MGAYRRLADEPVVGPGIDARELAPRSAGPRAAEPAMARWDDLIWQTVGGDPQAFALVKAVLWVESAGRQFAVSQTGCAGLMQFCTTTARSDGFRDIFGMGRVYPCRCDGPCNVPQPMQQDLESGDKQRILAHERAFVCALNDARFDPNKSIAAGWRYLSTLRQRVGGNIYLTYIGYNSGPKVAQRVFTRLGGNAKAKLTQIGRHLVGAMRPVYGASAEPRASSLLQVHLPRLKRAFRTYQAQARARATGALALRQPAEHRHAMGPHS